MQKITRYFQATASEMRQVTWPTQRQAALYTVLVIAISIAVSLFVGAFDFVFSQGISALINRI